eukprot:4974140-Alexandrium_andersonii.AAC.1
MQGKSASIAVGAHPTSVSAVGGCGASRGAALTCSASVQSPRYQKAEQCKSVCIAVGTIPPHAHGT